MGHCNLCRACGGLLCRLERFLWSTRMRIGYAMGGSMSKLIRKMNFFNWNRGHDHTLASGDTLCMKLDKACIPDGLQGGSSSEQPKKFLPVRQLKMLLTEEEVKRELLREKKRKRIKPDLVWYIREKAPKTFATLVACNHTDLIWDLYKSGFSDEKLPVKGSEDLLKNMTGDQRASLLGTARSFISAQWEFNPQVFHYGTYDYGDIGSDKRIPFLLSEEKHDGIFSTVWEKVLHKDHLQLYDDGTNMVPISTRTVRVRGKEENHFQLALKKLKVISSEDRKKIGTPHSEAQILKMMNKLKHRHFIRTIAYFRQGDDQYFLFPYATRGNLNDYWTKTTPSPEETYVRWLIGQMRGLADGIKQLHDKNCRHGDLKPGNILCFGAQGTKRGGIDLVIADVGLARIHAEVTALRANQPTNTKAGTVMYSPPEFDQADQSPWSRLFDVWSLGCIFLEFLVWMLQGLEGLKAFQRAVAAQDAVRRTFYSIESQGEGKCLIVHSAVTDRVEKLLADKRCSGNTGLRRVLRLIVDDMIVIALPEDGAANKREREALGRIEEEDDEGFDNPPTMEPEASQERPLVVIQPPTLIRAKDEKIRIKARELVDKLDRLLHEIDTGVTPAMALAVDRLHTLSEPPLEVESGRQVPRALHFRPSNNLTLQVRNQESQHLF